MHSPTEAIEAITVISLIVILSCPAARWLSKRISPKPYPFKTINYYARKR